VSQGEDVAWEAVRAFGARISESLGNGLVSAYVVGRLIHGGFRAGTTPIDVVCVLAGEHVSLGMERDLHRAARSVTEPSRLRCVLLSERDLEPPFVPERGTAPELLRLDDEGSCIAGEDLKPRLRRPNKKDMLAYVRSFHRLIEETLLRTDADERPTGLEAFELAATACRHRVFARENLLIWRETDAMVAFCMDPGPHTPAVPLVKEVLEVGPTLEPAAEHVHRNLVTFWRDVHREILS
jgi:hypothetical protein